MMKRKRDQTEPTAAVPEHITISSDSEDDQNDQEQVGDFPFQLPFRPEMYISGFDFWVTVCVCWKNNLLNFLNIFLHMHASASLKS